MPVVFGTHHQFRGNSTDLEWQTSFAMEGMLRDQSHKNLIRADKCHADMMDSQIAGSALPQIRTVTQLMLGLWYGQSTLQVVKR